MVLPGRRRPTDLKNSIRELSAPVYAATAMRTHSSKTSSVEAWPNNCQWRSPSVQTAHITGKGSLKVKYLAFEAAT